MSKQKNNSIADLVAANMVDIMNSDEYRSVFSKPNVKEAAKKIESVHGDKKQKKSKAEQIGLSVQTLSKVSEVLDDLGLTRQAYMALKTLESLVAAANDADADDKDVYVRRSAARNESTPIDLLAQLANDADSDVRIHVARNPSTPPEILGQLANDEDKFVRISVAYNPSAPSDILVQLANDEDDYVRYYVAEHSSTPPETLAQLANDKSPHVRKYVANNVSVSQDTLVQLANDLDEFVRQNVAEHSSTPPEALAQLANDRNVNVRYNVAINPSTPPGVLAQLANDLDEFVRQKVAAHQSTPPDILAQLANDENRNVRGVAKRRINVKEYGDTGNSDDERPPMKHYEELAQLANDRDPDVRANVARNRLTSPELLAQLADDEDENVRYHVAQNPSTSQDTLDQLANDKDEGIRGSVANNISVTPEILDRLSNDEDESVREIAKYWQREGMTSAQFDDEDTPMDSGYADDDIEFEMDTITPGDDSAPEELRDLLEELGIPQTSFPKTAASDKKWIQKAVKKPGRFEGWSMGKMKSRYNALTKKEKKSKDEISEMRALALGIRMKGGDVPGGKDKKGL